MRERLEEALQAFSEAIALAPGYRRAYLNRADVLEKLGRDAEAETDRQRAHDLMTAAREASTGQATGAPTVKKKKVHLGIGIATFVISSAAVYSVPGDFLPLLLFLAGWAGLYSTLEEFIELLKGEGKYIDSVGISVVSAVFGAGLAAAVSILGEAAIGSPDSDALIDAIDARVLGLLLATVVAGSLGYLWPGLVAAKLLSRPSEP